MSVWSLKNRWHQSALMYPIVGALILAPMTAIAQQGVISPQVPTVAPSPAASIGAAAVRNMERFLLNLERQVKTGDLSEGDALKLAQERRETMLKILETELERQAAE